MLKRLQTGNKSTPSRTLLRQICEVKQEHGSTQLMCRFPTIRHDDCNDRCNHDKQRTDEIRSEFLSPDTCIGNSHFSANATILNINRGDGDPKETSKKFEPTLEETAISPSPC